MLFDEIRAEMKILLFLTLCSLPISWCVKDKTWWKYTTIYEVFLPSFNDGNGDGMGDLKGLKLIIDTVFNHCSDEHPWFIKSIHKEDPYTDYFIWKDPKGYDKDGNPLPPNNWLSVFSGSAWKWNDRRKQFYLHRFSPQQPDFNLRNTAVKNELKKIMKFWVEKGVAGFRFDATKFLLEDEHFRDEPVSSPDVEVPYQYSDLKHIYTDNLPDSYKLLHELRTFLEKLTQKYQDFERIMANEDYIDGRLLYQYYGSDTYRIMHLPLNFILTLTVHYHNSSHYHKTINTYLNGLPEGAVPNWNVSY
ncbi:maltase 1-like [Planococcus citri]|uniref:maltase 1-like n=1 Tax=Planococcus citri TaxID=170843 RepID=UPI0031F89756